MKARSNFDLQGQLVEDSVFTVGSVFSVDGRKIVVKVNKDKNLPHLFFKGETIKNVSVGLSNYVKITKGFTDIICKVEEERLEEDKYQRSKEYGSERQKVERLLTVSVFGFYDNEGSFQHGIKEMPLVGSECRLLSKKEFENLHQLSSDEKSSIPLGSLVDEETQDISLPIDKLFAGHIGIFGNTGSGKSNTLAKIYTELFKLKGQKSGFKEKSKFIFIDFNGEYSKEEKDNILTGEKEVYTLRTRDDKGQRYPILKDEIEKLELVSILLNATEKTQRPFLHRALDRNWFDKDNDNHIKELGNIEKRLEDILRKKDKSFNVPFLEKFVKDFERIGFEIVTDENFFDKLLWNGGTNSFCLKNDRGPDIYADTDWKDFIGQFRSLNPSLAKPEEGLNYFQKIQFKILDQYYFELLKGYINPEHIGPLIGRLGKSFDMLERVFDIKKPKDSKETQQEGEEERSIKIINLRDVNLEMKKIVPLLVCKSMYDEQKKSYKDRSLHIVIDEAHNILSENSVREDEIWKDYRLETFEEIIKEGRKFGVFLTIASQRPSDISSTITSQLHNYFIHRLINDDDMRAIGKAVNYLDKLSYESIPNLSTGSCFIAGQMTQFPLSVKVKLLDEEAQPQSETINLNNLWDKTS